MRGPTGHSGKVILRNAYIGRKALHLLFGMHDLERRMSNSRNSYGLKVQSKAQETP